MATVEKVTQPKDAPFITVTLSRDEAQQLVRVIDNDNDPSECRQANPVSYSLLTSIGDALDGEY